MGRPTTLPQFQNDDKDFQMMQNSWASAINPVLKNPITSGIIVSGIALINGNTVVNHKLGRTPQGWFLVDLNASATVYRSAAFNDLTLTLNSSAVATAAIYVF